MFNKSILFLTVLSVINVTAMAERPSERVVHESAASYATSLEFADGPVETIAQLLATEDNDVIAYGILEYYGDNEAKIVASITHFNKALSQSSSDTEANEKSFSEVIRAMCTIYDGEDEYYDYERLARAMKAQGEELVNGLNFFMNSLFPDSTQEVVSEHVGRILYHAQKQNIFTGKELMRALTELSEMSAISSGEKSINLAATKNSIIKSYNKEKYREINGD
jgi:hypothetical protein